MTKNIFIILILTIVFSCGNDDEQFENLISDGNYQGYFDYNGISYWCSVQFENGKYIEWPPGGAMYQKGLGCITVGDYAVTNEYISFELDSFKHSWSIEECASDMLLPGEYELILTGKQDSIIFKRGEGENQITYHLKILE